MRRTIRILLALLALAAAGCGPHWTRTDLSPQAAKEQLPHDDALCEERANQVVPPMVGNEREMTGTPFITRAEDWNLDYDHDRIYDECMQSLGWSK